MDLTTDITIESGDSSVKRGGKEGGEKNPPAAARNLMPPFPGQRVYGTDPRRQGCVVGEILQQRENFSNHRGAPLTAPVPFRKTLCISGKRGPVQRRQKPADTALDSWPNCGQQGGTGALPLRPRTEKIQKLSLDRGGLLMEAVTARERRSRYSSAAPKTLCAGMALYGCRWHSDVARRTC